MRIPSRVARVGVVVGGVLLSSLGALGLPAVTRAAFTPAALLSGTAQFQFEEADSPAFSADGRYVVFRGSLLGAAGIYRRDLQTGQIVMVAGASKTEAPSSISESTVGAPDATAPSISANGQYIAFTTSAVLDPKDDTGSGCPQVYVRNMGTLTEPLSAGAPGAYTLVSAVNEGSVGLTYVTPCTPSSTTQLQIGGSQAASAVAMSANGKEVVFTVLGESNLTTGEHGAPATPARQVAVRDLETQTTTLVSTTPAGEPTQGGGAYPSLATEPGVGFISYPPGDQPVGSSAAISADGSTVAWEGTNVPEQVPSATEITERMASLGGPGKEVEPLWRRVADGPAAVTRRLLDAAGLNFYFFGSTAIENTGPVLAGAFATNAEHEFVPPVLNENGTIVATIANAPTKEGEEDYLFNPLSRKNGTPVPPADAYLVHVSDDQAVPVQVTALTATPSFAAENIRNTGVKDIAISPDGSRVAFNTVRTVFALTSPTPTDLPVEEVNFAYTYEVNLSHDILQRVTNTYSGSPPNGNPGLISFSGDDSLALESSASNLFFGDGTPGVSQVYLVKESQVAEPIAVQTTSSAPLTELPVSLWTLSATAVAERDGSVLLRVLLPGAGTLSVRADAQIPTISSSSPRKEHPRVRAVSEVVVARGTRKRPRVKSKDLHSSLVPTRTVAQAVASVLAPSELEMRLRVAAPYRTLVNGKKGLYCVLKVSFTAAGHEALSQEVPVTFLRVASHTKTQRSKRGKRAGGAHR
ncbi:MAG TPA: hypothetical protein VK781_13405 [Solirubrobacteraceae bacterium]|jgi:hypothetical protein|nr:hypothetical protein [Solirubrobacteraceae bacterium]